MSGSGNDLVRAGIGVGRGASAQGLGATIYQRSDGALNRSSTRKPRSRSPAAAIGACRGVRIDNADMTVVRKVAMMVGMVGVTDTELTAIRSRNE